jgi:DNA-binding NarL/FixJ family response regulator
MADIEGKGVVNLCIKQVATDLNLSPRTVRDYIRKCRQFEFFRHIKWDGADYCLVYYSGLAKVIASKSKTGPVQVLLSPADLKFKKAVIVEAIVASQQEQSFYKAKEQQCKTQQTNKPAMVTTDQLFNKRPSVYAGGTFSIEYKTSRFTFVSPNFPNFGTSQQSIAHIIGRSVRTVQRRLSNQYRQLLAQRHNDDLSPLPRTQLAKEVGDKTIVDHINAENLERIPFIFFKGKAWDPLCNVYLTDRQTKGQKRLNRRILSLDTSIDFFNLNRPIPEA